MPQSSNDHVRLPTHYSSINQSINQRRAQQACRDATHHQCRGRRSPRRSADAANAPRRGKAASAAPPSCGETRTLGARFPRPGRCRAPPPPWPRARRRAPSPSPTRPGSTPRAPRARRTGRTQCAPLREGRAHKRPLRGGDTTRGRGGAYRRPPSGAGPRPGRRR